MTDLADFLLARIAEDEALAREATRHGVSNSPYRLAECEAKRRIVKPIANHGAFSRACDLCGLLQLLALPYADHEDFQGEWRV